MAPFSLLITGASGYVGGTILTALLTQEKAWAKQLDISTLARKDAHVEKFRELGVKPVHFDSFDDVDTLREIATAFDIIIHAAAGWHTPSAKALIAGQAERRKRTGRAVHYLHMSGTSNLSDRPHTVGYTETKTFSDRDDDVYAYEQHLNARDPYLQRTTDLTVVHAGAEGGVATYIVMAPTIFGVGTGPFNRYSFQLPAMIAAMLRTGDVGLLGDGATVWNHVHIDDLAALFEVLLARITAGAHVLSGRKGIYFCESGAHSHQEMSEMLARAAKELGVVESAEVRKVSLAEAAELWGFGNKTFTERNFGANARTKADLGRDLGWTPQKEHMWNSTFALEITEMQKNAPQERDVPKFVYKE